MCHVIGFECNVRAATAGKAPKFLGLAYILGFITLL